MQQNRIQFIRRKFGAGNHFESFTFDGSALVTNKTTLTLEIGSKSASGNGLKLDDKGRLICTLTNLAATVGDDGKSISMKASDKNVDIWSIGESHPLVIPYNFHK